MTAGRPEKPIDTEGPAADFARYLRNVRRASGLTYKQLNANTFYASSTLSKVLNGNRLHSWDKVEAIVVACRGDLGEAKQLYELAEAGMPLPAELLADVTPELPKPRRAPAAGPGDVADGGEPDGFGVRDRVRGLVGRSQPPPWAGLGDLAPQARRAFTTTCDPGDAETMADLALLLDHLRQAHVHSWRQLAQVSGVPHTTLHESITKREFPSHDTVESIIRVYQPQNLRWWSKSWLRLLGEQDQANAAKAMLRTPRFSEPAALHVGKAVIKDTTASLLVSMFIAFWVTLGFFPDLPFAEPARTLMLAGFGAFLTGIGQLGWRTLRRLRLKAQIRKVSLDRDKRRRWRIEERQKARLVSFINSSEPEGV